MTYPILLGGYRAGGTVDRVLAYDSTTFAPVAPEGFVQATATSVVDVAYDPLGRYYAYTIGNSSYDTHTLWDIEAATATAGFTTSASGARCAFSPDGATLALADGKVRLYDPVTKELQAVTALSFSSIRQLDFSADGSLLAVTDYYSGVHIYATADMSLVRTIYNGSSNYIGGVFDHTGDTIVITRWNGGFACHAVATGDELTTLGISAFGLNAQIALARADGCVVASRNPGSSGLSATTFVLSADASALDGSVAGWGVPFAGDATHPVLLAQGASVALLDPVALTLETVITGALVSEIRVAYPLVAPPPPVIPPFWTNKIKTAEIL